MYSSLQRVFILRQIGSLVLGEAKNGTLLPSTLHAVSAARHLEGPISILIPGHGVNDAAEAAAAVEGVESVIVADDSSLANTLAEPTAKLLAKLQERKKYSSIVAASGSYGRNILPRAAALLDVQAVADVVEIIDMTTFIRPMYAGNVLATVKLLEDDKVRMLTIRPTAFEPVGTTGGSATVEKVEASDIDEARKWIGKSEWVEDSEVIAERPELGQAKVVVSGGRALKSKENFKMIEELADELGGAVGASRAAVDAGFAPNDLQVGQTGKIVAPELYIAIGISGAIQHVAGIKDSKCIVAINSDGEAPIFQVIYLKYRSLSNLRPLFAFAKKIH